MPGMFRPQQQSQAAALFDGQLQPAKRVAVDFSSHASVAATAVQRNA